MTASTHSPTSATGSASTGSSILTREQLGHIRHIDNLSRQLPNDWSFMQTKAMGQFDFGGFRFQLSYMAYAMGLAHVHRLPNAPGVFKPVLERLIEKLISPEVWLYWRDVSRGGAVFNAHLSEGYHEEWDPVARDNIMYSAYVQSLASMYHYMFNDDRYTKPEALTFEHWSFFWGGPPKRFAYDEHSLHEHIYWQMAQTGFLGVACEPNCAFQICNQPAILGFRMHDLATGGDVAADVTRSYEQAWAQEGGRLDSAGHYNMMRLQDSGTVVPNAAKAPWIDAWCGMMLNMRNRDFVRQHYAAQISEFVVDGPESTKTVPIPPPAELMGQTVDNDTCDFGWVAAWVSEMGDESLLSGLLGYADRYLNPTWHAGGLYYPRNDTEHDVQGNPILMAPLTGNALIAYARLNVPDGLWKLYNEPWSPSHFTEPALSEVADDIEVSQADFDSSTGILAFRLHRHSERRGAGTVVVDNVVDCPQWSLHDGDRRAELAVGGARSSVIDTPGSGAEGIRVSHVEAGIELRIPAGGPRTFHVHTRS